MRRSIKIESDQVAVWRWSLLPRLCFLGALAALGACAGAEDDPQELGEQAEALTLDAGVIRTPVGEPGVIVIGGPVRLDAGVAISVDGGPFFGDGGVSTDAVGLWQFDDCHAGISVLSDSSPSHAGAVKSPSVACADGIRGSSVWFDEHKDTVEADHPAAFALKGALTVAAWVNPSSATRGSIVNKDKPSGQAFELSISGKKVTFSVTVQKKNGAAHLVSSSFAIPLHQWTHLAGVYDGQFVRLFSGGVQVGQVSAPGTIADQSAPVRIGNSRDHRWFAGRIDEVQLFNRALSEFEIAQLSCITTAPTLLVTPANGGSVDADTTLHFDVSYKNNNLGACQPTQLFFEPDTNVLGITVATANTFQSAASGETAHFTVDVTPSTDADPGPQSIPFQLLDFGAKFGSSLSGQLQFTLNAPTGCFVRTSRELLMRDLSVVEDPNRSVFTSTSADSRNGVWTFAALMQQAAPTPEDAPTMVENMFKTWLSDQTINTFSVPARTQMKQLVLDPWPRLSDGRLDLTRAPLRLLAIVNRPDLRDLAKDKAGEGRFVFGVLDGFGNPQQFTIILEYALPATSTDDVLSWANEWHALGALPFPSEQYNVALAALTSRFAGRGAAPSLPNGSALLRLRTNEIALSFEWELREFRISKTSGMLEPAEVELTPDTSFINESPLVADFVNQNEAAVLQEQHVLPELFEGKPFLGGSSFNNLIAWRSSGITNPEARFRFSLNTCNGCHSSEETGTPFLQINPRSPGTVASISGFMSGITIADPVTGVNRTLNDLARRNVDLKAIVCGGTASTVSVPLPARTTVARSAAVTPSRTTFLSKGIGRVH